MRIYEEPWAPAPEYPARPRVGRNARAVLTVGLALAVVAVSILAVRGIAEAALGQCAPSWLAGTDPQLCLNATVSQRILTVSGTTSLPDGAILEISAEDDGTGYNQNWATGAVDTTVAGGGFGRTFDVSAWGAGTITVTAQFVVAANQPQAVIDRYGWGGPGLRGPDVTPDYDLGDPAPMVVQSTVQVDLPAF